MTSSPLQFTVTRPTHIGADKAPEEGRFSRNLEEEEELDSLLEELESGQLREQEALRLATQMLRRYPENLEVQNVVGGRYWALELRDEAAEVYERAFQQAIALIPEEFKGIIAWHELDNRSFLRVAHGHLLGLIHQRKGRAADQLSKKMLTWCPQDNLGIRYMRGDILLLAGKKEAALKTYLANADNAASWYQAGKLTFDAGNFVTACTYIRKGIFDNPYIAEGLTGRTIVNEHLYWHSSNMHGPEWALDHLENAGQDWTQAEIDFVDWVFNSSAVLRERAASMEVHEILTVERDIARRQEAIEAHSRLKASINDELSGQMVQRCTNRYGIDYWPWEREGALRRQP